MDQEDLIESLINEPAPVWVEALRPFEDGVPVTCRNLMHAVYEVALLKSDDLQDLEWVEVAVRAADLDARFGSDESVRFGAAYNAMRLRARYISIVGSQAGNHVLDREIVLRWILEGLTDTPESVAALAGTLWARLKEVIQASKPDDDPAILDLKRLRQMKHRLTVAQVLFDSGQLPPDSVIRSWLPIRPILP